MDRLAIGAVKFALRQKASCILLYASAIVLGEALLLYVCAYYEGVLRIADGIGLLDNFGLLSNLIGNAIIPFVVKVYYDESCALLNIRGMRNCPLVRASNFRSERLLIFSSKSKTLFLFFVFIGLAFWLSNTSFHIFRLSQSHWGYSVFDSIDHPLSFIANRINNLYTWVFLLPFCAHIFLCTTYRLVAIMEASIDGGSVKFDLLAEDHNGGFSVLDRAQVYFIVLFCIVYMQITAHTGTFKLNFEHLSAYVSTTALFLFGNTIFLRKAYVALKELKRRATEEFKNKAYKNEGNGLGILKYYYDNKTRKFSGINIAIKTTGVVASLAIKGTSLYSAITEKLT